MKSQTIREHEMKYESWDIIDSCGLIMASATNIGRILQTWYLHRIWDQHFSEVLWGLPQWKVVKRIWGFTMRGIHISVRLTSIGCVFSLYFLSSWVMCLVRSFSLTIEIQYTVICFTWVYKRTFLLFTIYI